MEWRDRQAGNWLDDADELTQLLWRQHGVLSHTQARAHMSRGALAHKVASGRWRHPHPNVYLAHSGQLTREQRVWIAVLGVGSGAVLAGLTAAQRCGLRGYPEDRIHLLIPAGCRERRPPDGVVVHRSAVLPAVDVYNRQRPPHTTAARSLVDAAQWADTDDRARAIVAAGFQQRLVGGDDIHLVLKRMPRARRRALMAETAEDAIGGAQSLPEGLFVRLLRRHRLPVPRLQVRRRDTDGRIRYLDGYYDQWRIHIEIDGAQHIDAGAYWSDMKRQNALWIAGDRVLRFPSWAVRHEPANVVRQVRLALLAAGWRP